MLEYFLWLLDSGNSVLESYLIQLGRLRESIHLKTTNSSGIMETFWLTKFGE